MKIYRILFLIIIETFQLNIYCQSPIFEWAIGIGGTEDDFNTSLVCDNAGFIYSSGVFTGTVDFDPGPEVFELTSNGFTDIFIQKLDAHGNLIWAHSLGGIWYNENRSIILDSNNNLIITGVFSSTIDFDPGPGIFELTSNGFSDSFILKLDNDGNFIWAKSFGGTNQVWMRDIAVDNSSNLVLVGIFWDVADFDPGPQVFELTAIGEDGDCFILKLDADSGDFIWAKSIGPNEESSDTYPDAIVIDSEGAIYITGYFGDTTDFDPGPGIFELTSNGLSDIFILKLNSDGEFSWAKSIGGTGLDSGTSLNIDNSNNLIVMGTFRDTVDFSFTSTPNLQTASDTDAFILKFDSNNNLAWLTTLNTSGSIIFWDSAKDQLDNYYIYGRFSGTITYEVGNTIKTLTAEGIDTYVFKLDQSGNFLWGRSISGDFDNYSTSGRSILVDSSYNIILAGRFSQTVDFDPDTTEYLLTSNGIRDYFITKWSQDFSSNTFNPIKEFDVAIYPNPTFDHVLVSKKFDDEIQLSIIDINGKLIRKKRLIQNENLIDLTNIASGLYFITLESSNYLEAKIIYKN